MYHRNNYRKFSAALFTIQCTFVVIYILPDRCRLLFSFADTDTLLQKNCGEIAVCALRRTPNACTCNVILYFWIHQASAL